MKDVNIPPQYEALVFLGYDNASERYVAHWIDVFGGRFSETLGYGTRSGDSIKFIFEEAVRMRRSCLRAGACGQREIKG